MYQNRIASVILRARGALLPALVLFTGSPTGSSPVHPFRLSIADVKVTESALEVRIRFFWDDLQFAVMESTSDMEFELARNERVQGIVGEYINEMLVFEAGDGVVPGTVIEHGVEEAPRIDEVMWWYRLDYPLPALADRIHIRNRLLFNMFEDQRNLVHLKTRSGKERTYYFNWSEDSISIPVT